MNMNHSLQRYEFAPLTDRGPEPHGRARPDREDEARKLVEAEIEAARSAAFAEGEAKARAAMADSLEARRIAALEAIAKTLAATSRNLSGSLLTIEREAAELASSIGAAIGEQALSEAPLTVLRPLFSETLSKLADEARITITVQADMVEPIQAEISDLSAETGFGGRIRVTDGAAHIADCRLDWGDGGIERSLQTITGEITERLGRHGIGADGRSGVEES